MERVFSNTDAAIAGGIALVEFFAVAIYLMISTRSLTKEIIDKGRLIPTMFAGSIAGQQPYLPASTYPPQQQYPPPQYGGPIATAPQQGLFAAQDNPPSYSEVKGKM